MTTKQDTIRRDLWGVKVYNKFEEFWCLEEICRSYKSAKQFRNNTKKQDPFAMIKIVHPLQSTVDFYLTVGNQIH